MSSLTKRERTALREIIAEARKEANRIRSARDAVRKELSGSADEIPHETDEDRKTWDAFVCDVNVLIDAASARRRSLLFTAESFQARLEGRKV